MTWDDYRIWLAAALILGILEIVAPAWILLGFALAAGAVGALLALGGAPAAFLAGSLPVPLAIFAGLALVMWLILRKAFRPRGQVKTFDRDINDI